MLSDDRAIAIGSTFTAEAIQAALAFWTARLAEPPFVSTAANIYAGAYPGRESRFAEAPFPHGRARIPNRTP
jgi:hypothetical protein